MEQKTPFEWLFYMDAIWFWYFIEYLWKILVLDATFPHLIQSQDIQALDVQLVALLPVVSYISDIILSDWLAIYANAHIQ